MIGATPYALFVELGSTDREAVRHRFVTQAVTGAPAPLPPRRPTPKPSPRPNHDRGCPCDRCRYGNV